MARPWSARCYGVDRQREGSRQNSIGGSGVLSLRHFSGWFSLSLGAWVPKNLARRRMVSAGAMLLDRLGPPGFRFTERAQTASGAPACFLSGIFRAGSLYPLARGCRRIWRGEGWFRPARCCSTGSGRLDLDLLISGPRVNLVYQPYARGGADGQAVVLRGSSPTRGVAPKQENKAIADQSPLLKLSLRRVRFQRTSTRQQLDCAKTL